MMSKQTGTDSGQPQLGKKWRGSMMASRRRKLSMGLAALLSGGSLFQACGSRVHDAFVIGVKDVLFNAILTPASLSDLLGVNLDAAGG